MFDQSDCINQSSARKSKSYLLVTMDPMLSVRKILSFLPEYEVQNVPGRSACSLRKSRVKKYCQILGKNKICREIRIKSRLRQTKMHWQFRRFKDSKKISPGRARTSNLSISCITVERASQLRHRRCFFLTEASGGLTDLLQICLFKTICIQRFFWLLGSERSAERILI